MAVEASIERSVCGLEAGAAVAAGAWSMPVVRRRNLTAVVTVGIFVVVGFGLRLLAARHDLWLDEIWSIDLVQGLSSPDQVFWRISHDNNHFLNSLWLYGLGPDQEPSLYRMPAVVFGTLSVIVAAHIGLRRSLATAIAAAALVSTSALLVTYGSEARGYAGLILALLVAVDAFDRSIGLCSQGWSAQAPADTIRQRCVLGAAIGLGALFHLTMVAALPLFGAASVLRRRGAGQPWGQAIGDTLTVLRPALILLVPAMGCVIGGIMARHGFEVGGATPFSAPHALDGIGTALRLASGLPETLPLWLVCCVCGLGIGLASVVWLDPTRRWLVICGTVLLPCGLLALQLPNLEFPRYFLIPATIFTLVMADAIGALWDQGSHWSRLAAGALLAAILLGQTPSLNTLITVGRGSYTAVVERMASGETATYASDARFRVQTVIDFVAAHRHRSVAYIGPDAFCSTRPRWYIATDDAAPRSADRIDLGPEACRASFDKIATYPTSALSGMAWTLYRRSD